MIVTRLLLLLNFLSPNLHFLALNSSDLMECKIFLNSFIPNLKHLRIRAVPFRPEEQEKVKKKRTGFKDILGLLECSRTSVETLDVIPENEEVLLEDEEDFGDQRYLCFSTLKELSLKGTSTTFTRLISHFDVPILKAFNLLSNSSNLVKTSALLYSSSHLQSVTLDASYESFIGPLEPLKSSESLCFPCLRILRLLGSGLHALPIFTYLTKQNLEIFLAASKEGWQEWEAEVSVAVIQILKSNCNSLRVSNLRLDGRIRTSHWRTNQSQC